MTWTLALAHALLFVLALPPFDLWVLVFAVPAPLALLAIMARTTAGAVFITAIVQFIMWLWLVRWIIPVTPVGYPMLAMYMFIWPSVFVWIIRRVSLHARFSRWPMTFVLPVVWVGVEFFRGDVLFYGYPWYLLGHPLIAVPMLVQSADLFGTYFVSFLAAMVSGFIVDLVRTRWPARIAAQSELQRQHGSRVLRFAIVAIATVWAGNLAYGAWRMNQTASLSPGPRVLAMQTNLPQDIKVGWSKEEQARDVQQFMAETRRAVGQINPKPDLVVWPETMVPGVGLEAQTVAKLREMYSVHGWDLQHLYQWSLAAIELQRELELPLLIGSEAWINTSDIREGTSVRLDPEYTYNSAYLVQGDPPFQRYDKFFLTPFGETMPYISAWPWLERQFLNIGVGADLSFNLDSNPDLKLLELRTEPSGENVLLATPICFEDTVARFCRRMVYPDGQKRADVILNLSNDGWFNISDSDRKLHAMSARFRSIENRVPTVRSVNTGMSLSIDSAGRVLGAVGQGGYGTASQPGWVLADVQLDSRSTLYGRIGELWPLLCLIGTITGFGWTFTRKPSAAIE